MLMGLVLVLAIVFMSVKAFSQGNQKLDTFGLMVIIFIGIILATVLGLFPVYIIIIFIILSLALIAMKKLFFDGGGD